MYAVRSPVAGRRSPSRAISRYELRALARMIERLSSSLRCSSCREVARADRDAVDAVSAEMVAPMYCFVRCRSIRPRARIVRHLLIL